MHQVLCRTLNMPCLILPSPQCYGMDVIRPVLQMGDLKPNKAGYMTRVIQMMSAGSGFKSGSSDLKLTLNTLPHP